MPHVWKMVGRIIDYRKSSLLDRLVEDKNQMKLLVYADTINRRREEIQVEWYKLKSYGK